MASETLLDKDFKDSAIVCEFLAGRTPVYLDNITNAGIKEIFNINPDKYAFKHIGSGIVFKTDGSDIFGLDLADMDTDPFMAHGLNTMFMYYEKFGDFLDTFKNIELVIDRQVYISNYDQSSRIDLDMVEIKYHEIKDGI